MEAERRGIRTHLLEQGEDAAQLARTADADRLGVAGGDGSLAPVAAVAMERDQPFVCVPLGTRNHFARDVGLDTDDPLDALAAFDGAERRIDVGCINGRIFLNNVSLGVYARLVHRRERHRRRRDALARLRALGLLLRRRGPTGFTVDGTPIAARVLLVANNHYSLDLFSVGEREQLDEGRLYLYVAAEVFPGSWEERSGDRFVVDTRRHRVEAAIDGEPEQLETPLEFTIDPLALRVLLPSG